MSFDSKSVATSTPKTGKRGEDIFRCVFDFSEIKPDAKAREIKKTQPPRAVKKARSKLNFGNENYLEKRRKKAVESMKIAEDRRHRLTKKEQEFGSPSENKENVPLNRNEFLPDGRLRLNRKQLKIRSDKHRRINEFLADQKARKALKKV